MRFNCDACGKCCSKISGFTTGSEREFIRDYGYGKLPLIQLTEPEQMSFPLWDFEAKRFREYEKGQNINAKIKPFRGVFDLNSNKFIVFTYYIDSESCPFQTKDKKCSIYNTKRAFICHLFPFNKSPYLKTGEEITKAIFGKCHNVTQIADNLDYSKDIYKQLHDSFGDIFLAALQQDYVIEWSNKLIIGLMKEKKIRPALNYPYDKLKKRIENAEKIDLMDFLVEINYKTEEDVKELIERFEGFEDGKEIMSKKG